MTRLFTSMLPIAVSFGSTMEPPSTPLSIRHLHQRLAGDRGGRGVLSGVADAVAVEDARVEGVGGRDRDAVLLRGAHDIVIGARLRRRHDDAVDRGVLDDLVQDFELARRIVGRRFRAEQQDVGADEIGGDGGADIDRVEEAVAGRMRDDGECQLAVLGMEVLGRRRSPWRRRRSCSRRPPSRCLAPGLRSCTPEAMRPR